MRRQYVELSFLALRLRFFAVRLACFNVSPSFLATDTPALFELEPASVRHRLELDHLLAQARVGVQIVLVRA
jgi:hypothetical protein